MPTTMSTCFRSCLFNILFILDPSNIPRSLFTKTQVMFINTGLSLLIPFSIIDPGNILTGLYLLRHRSCPQIQVFLY